MTTIQTNKLIAALAVTLSLAVAAPSTFAQAPTTTPPPQKQSFLHKLFGKKQPTGTMQPRTTTRLPYGSTQTPHHPMATGTMGHFGSIIGNKNTHVYHLPGDHSTLPAAKNRVYFTSVAQATAAGFHAAGGHSAMGAHAKGHMSHPPSAMSH